MHECIPNSDHNSVVNRTYSSRVQELHACQGWRNQGAEKALAPPEVKVGRGLSPPKYMKNAKMGQHLYKIRDRRITARQLKCKRKYPTL